MNTNPAENVPSQAEGRQLDQLYQELRSAIHALGLYVKVVESGQAGEDLDDYIKAVAQTSEQIEQLVQKLVFKDLGD